MVASAGAEALALVSDHEPLPEMQRDSDDRCRLSDGRNDHDKIKKGPTHNVGPFYYFRVANRVRTGDIQNHNLAL